MLIFCIFIFKEYFQLKFIESDFLMQVDRENGNVTPNLVPDVEMSQAIIPYGAREFNDNYNLGKHGSPDYWDKYFDQSRLGEFKQKAYEDPYGYSVRVNEVTGKKELFIAGTRSSRQWAQNVSEGLVHLGVVNPLGVVSEYSKLQYIEELKQLIEDQGIEVVYGHSRGAAYLGGIDLPIQKIGIDGATVLGPHDDFLNINQSINLGGGVFDNIIGFGHKNTLHLKQRKFHDVTVPKTATKRNRPPTTVRGDKKKSKGFTTKVKDLKDFTIGTTLPRKRTPRSRSRQRVKAPLFKPVQTPFVPHTRERVSRRKRDEEPVERFKRFRESRPVAVKSDKREEKKRIIPDTPFRSRAIGLKSKTKTSVVRRLKRTRRRKK